MSRSIVRVIPAVVASLAMIPAAIAASQAAPEGRPLLPDLAPCFDETTWRFVGPGGACPLDTGAQLEVPDWTRIANPVAVPPLGGLPPTTWNVTLEPTDPSLAWYRVATGSGWHSRVRIRPRWTPSIKSS